MFALFILVLVLGLLTTGVISCYGWWKELSAPNVVYWILVAVLIGEMFFAVIGSKHIPNHTLKMVCLFISAVFFIVLIYGSVLLAVRGLILLVGKLIHADNSFIHFMHNKKLIIPVILGFSSVLGVAGFINMGIIRETDFSVSIDKKSELKSITAAVISDTHIGVAAQNDTIDTIVEKVNDMNVDVVFLVGDIFDESTTTGEMEHFTKAFSNVQSTFGTYYVLGNHEGYSRGDSTDYFRNAGITVLQDSAVKLGDDITVIGLRDAYDAKAKGIDEIIADEEVDMNKPVILLKHEPVELNSYAKAGIDLSFSGHTHGEQFPLTKTLFSIANDMMYGQEKFSDMTAITTSGAGGWGFHYKLPAKSEIAKVEISFDK